MEMNTWNGSTARLGWINLITSHFSLEIPSDSSDEIDVLRHDGDSTSMDGSHVGVVEHLDEECLGCFLKCIHGQALDHLHLDVLLTGDLLHRVPDDAFEGQTGQEELGSPLVAADRREHSVSLRSLRCSVRGGPRVTGVSRGRERRDTLRVSGRGIGRAAARRDQGGVARIPLSREQRDAPLLLGHVIRHRLAGRLLLLLTSHMENTLK
ncbi:hypothetical protein PENTCL1PPCAC_24684, partial [Pristionchus entomophagus]